ncbi:MAG TPA: alpha/beta hydrolase [Alcanivoracaceae bacterium]|nr:alpha/beta hydrolase [Alcanivoracaceae bacterium]
MKKLNVTTATVMTPEGITLAYDERGDKDAPVVLFIMGLSAQMVFWPEPLLNAVAEQGYRVIRFDNRDVGHSTKIRGRIHYSPNVAIARALIGLDIKPPYTLHDMVTDTLGLMDELDIEKAHLVGASMGGMISQLLAGKHPERVLSLTSIMSSSNHRFLPPPTFAALKTLVGSRVQINSEEEYVAYGKKMMRVIGGTLDHDSPLIEQMFAESWQRGLYPRGVLQQFMATLSTGDLRPYLRKIKCPTRVIHGTVDPLLRPACGRSSAKNIKGAKLSMLKGMGHDLPESLLPTISKLIVENAQEAER